MPKPSAQPSPDYATAKRRSRNPGYGSAIAENLCVNLVSPPELSSRPRPAILSWAADLPTLIFMFYTPKGLSRIACVAHASVFAARRAEFEAVARGVALAR